MDRSSALCEIDFARFHQRKLCSNNVLTPWCCANHGAGLRREVDLLAMEGLMSMLRILPALVVGLVAMLTSAQAAPVSAGPELAQASQSMSEVSHVQWRRGY